MSLAISTHRDTYLGVARVVALFCNKKARQPGLVIRYCEGDGCESDDGDELSTMYS